ncbi:MAG: hypothetical protein IH849_01775 [Acidobacteria bacterium]|nr:hypothetical protein [Acidobacteriota bacterium]
MTDTSAEARAEFRKRLLATDATRRIQMVSGMFSTARALAGAAASSSTGKVDPTSAAIFERMYRTDFSARELAAIAEHLETAHRGDLRPSYPNTDPGQPDRARDS